MAPNLKKIIGFGDIHGPKPYKFIRFGDIHGPKPYRFIRFEPTTQHPTQQGTGGGRGAGDPRSAGGREPTPTPPVRGGEGRAAGRGRRKPNLTQARERGRQPEPGLPGSASSCAAFPASSAASGATGWVGEGYRGALTRCAGGNLHPFPGRQTSGPCQVALRLLRERRRLRMQHQSVSPWRGTVQAPLRLAAPQP
jgi:hypothetical protein